MTTATWLGQLVAILLGAGYAMSQSAHAVTTYVATPLGLLGGQSSVGYGINASGQVTGFATIGKGGDYHAFIFSDGILADLGTLGGSDSTGWGISDSGMVVGEAAMPGTTSLFHGFSYASGTIRDLGTFGGLESGALGTNGAGDIAGYATSTGNASVHAFLFTNGVMRDLGTLGGVQSVGRGVNAVQQVTGFSSTGTDPNSPTRAFLHSNGAMHELGTLGGLVSDGRAINSSGQVAGSSSISALTGVVHAFLYSAGAMIDLGTLSGRNSYGYGINARGQIVGLAQRVDANGADRAFLYSDGAMYDLNSLVNSGLANNVLTEARAINDAGQIVANGCDGITCQAFRLDPVGSVEPVAVVTVVEYYNRSLDHYFITWKQDEIGKLDAALTIKGWLRTGYWFKAFASMQPGSSPVCRFYIPPLLGDSHFFGRGTTECNDTATKNPSFVLESPDFMQLYLPVAGVCPANSTQVYRVFSNRADANHRYMTDRSVRDAMVAKGWLVEGDGPDSVVMCAPQS